MFRHLLLAHIAVGRSWFAWFVANHFDMVKEVKNVLALMVMEAMFGAVSLYAKKIRGEPNPSLQIHALASR